LNTMLITMSKDHYSTRNRFSWNYVCLLGFGSNRSGWALIQRHDLYSAQPGVAAL
jgi:hypothetical protein